MNPEIILGCIPQVNLEIWIKDQIDRFEEPFQIID